MKWAYTYVHTGIEENQNGVDSNVGEDSDSLGNSKSSKASITPPAKEKRKPFFKKVSIFVYHLFFKINNGYLKQIKIWGLSLTV